MNDEKKCPECGAPLCHYCTVCKGKYIEINKEIDINDNEEL
jgi:hypothetical protein